MHLRLSLRATILASAVIVACSGADRQTVLDDSPPPPNPHPTVTDSGPDVVDSSAPGTDASVDAPPVSHCEPETDAVLCQLLDRNCGGTVVNDTCGKSRSIASCGSCGATEVCPPNGKCCAPESDIEFCARTASTCNAVNMKDNCGTVRPLVVCGSPCGKGSACVDGKCTACVPKACAAGQCGLVDDGCHPAPLDCGNCDATHACVANACVLCQPPSDQQLCINNGNHCGPLAVVDICGKQRNIAECGAVDILAKCDGICQNGTCCVPAPDHSLCVTAGKTCGPLVATDNCNQVRNIANCGACVSPAVCSVAGTCL